MEISHKTPGLRRSFAESLQHLRETIYVPPEVRTPFDDGPKVSDKETYGVAFLEATVGEEVDLSNLTLSKTCLAFCNLRASFRNSDLSNSRFYETLFHGVDFDDASLAHSDLRCCDFQFVSFCRADLRGVDLRASQIVQCDFTDALLQGARVDYRAAPGMNLTAAQRDQIDWYDSGEEDLPHDSLTEKQMPPRAELVITRQAQTTGNVFQFNLLGLLVLMTVVAVVAALIGQQVYNVHRWSSAYRGAQDCINALCSRRPAHVSPDAWECAIGWARTASANMSYDDTERSRQEWESLHRDLAKQLDPNNPADLATIEWVWDRMAQMNDRSRDYVSRFRPQYHEELQFHLRRAAPAGPALIPAPGGAQP